MVVECNHVNLNKTQQRWVAAKMERPIFFAKEAPVNFYSLTPSFFNTYKNCPEIEQKQGRPYYVLLIEWCGYDFAIPLRSHIKHKLQMEWKLDLILQKLLLSEIKNLSVLSQFKFASMNLIFLNNTKELLRNDLIVI